MRMHRHSRRRFLAGLGLGTAALPFIPLLERDAEAGGGVPTRIIICYQGHGSYPANWNPTGSENAFTLSPILEPLASGPNGSHQQDIVVVRGIKNAARRPPGDPHIRSMVNLLTGTELLSEPGSAEDALSLPGGISVDQYIAQRIAQGPDPTVYDSILSSVLVPSPGDYLTLSASGPGQRVAAERDPYAQFDRMFGSFDPSADAAALAHAKATKHAVLDHVDSRLEVLRTRVGSADKDKIEAHLAAIADLQARVDVDLPDGCIVPELEPGHDWASNADVPATSRAHIDVLVRALACDLTRVAILQYGGQGGSVRTAPWLGINDEYHDISHNHASSQANLDKLTTINNWLAGELNYLLDALAGVDVGAGSLLDHTVVIWTSGMGWIHSTDNLPIVIAGGAGGKLATGRFLTYDQAPFNDVMVSLCHLMGFDDVTTFGNPELCNGPLPGLA